MKTKLTNNYHNTECNVIAKKDSTLTYNQIITARKKLCGIKDCTCGDVAGCRPCQVDEMHNGVYRLIAER